MPKNPNSRSKPVKRDEPMNGAMKFFLGGCVAELYLLIVRRFYANGTTVQMLAWYDYLLYFAIAGAVIAAASLVAILLGQAKGKHQAVSIGLTLAGAVCLPLIWYFNSAVSAMLPLLFLLAAAALWTAAALLGLTGLKDKKRRLLLGAVFAAGLFLGTASGLVRLLNVPALNLLCVLVPVTMLLGILWSLYDRECAWALTILGAGVLALWLCRRGVGNQTWNTAVNVGAVLFILLMLAVVLATRQASRHGGRLGKVRLLPANADCLPVYVSCGLSAVAVAVALFSSTAAYYAIWALAIVIFALAVYYTVKQL